MKMPSEEAINRKEFLMKMGFRGAALMAVLSSCINAKESIITPTTGTTTSGTTTSGTTTSGTTTSGTTTSGTTTSGTTTSGTTTSGTTTSGTTKYLLSIDLSLAANATLKNVGGYIRQSGIVVAKISSTAYAAVTQTCSHEGQKQVIFQNGDFYCTAHGALYDTNGKGLNSDGRNGLTTYQTQLNGTILNVF